MWRKVVCGCGLMKLRHNIAEAVGIGTGIGRKSPTPLLFVGVGSVESASHPSSSCVKSFYFTKKYSNHGNNKAVAAVAPLFHRSTTSFSTFSTTGDDDNHSNSNSNSNANSNSNSNSKPISNIEKNITCAEAKKLMRLVNVETLKMKLGMDGKEVIDYTELLKACESMGVARSPDEAVAFARVLDDAGVILLFRDKVYLYPDKVVDLVRRAMPLALHPEDDSMRNEFKMLQEKKEEIDVQAHKQVRCILWSGLGLAVIHIGLFFRLTFWEFSWDVMEPIAFFSTTTAVLIGYAYFLLTSRDPTYEDLLKRLFLSRQRKLFKKLNFDVNRFKELQTKCKTPLDASTSIRNRLGLELKLEDSLHRD